MESGKRETFLFFWKPDTKNGIYSQWWISKMVIDGVEYNSCEQYMMAMKAELMGDKEMQEKIMKEPSPRAHQSLGRKVKNFDSDKWDANCLAIVTKGNYHKFSQDPDLKNSIIRSAGLTLVEASPVDINWGIGFTADHPDAPIRSKWRGKNMLGEAIMKARTRIISENNIENMRNGTAGDDVIIIEDDIDEKIKTNNNNNDTSNNKNNNNNNNGNKNNNNNNGNKNNNNKSNNNNGNNKNNNNNNSSNNNNNKNNNNNGNKKNNNNNNNNNKK